MTDKELKKLSRKELLELLVVQTRKTEQLEEKVKRLEASLADRRVKIETAGSLAEAAVKISGVLEAAQKAAELYLENIKQQHTDGENENV